MVKRGCQERNLFTWICENPTRQSIIAILSKPKLISEIANDVSKRLDLKKRQAISSYIRELKNLGIIKCLTPGLSRSKPGNIFGLTNKGIKIASKIYSQIKRNFSYTEPRSINWLDYGWCLTGTQKKILILSLDNKPARQLEILEKIKQSYTNRNNEKGMSRENLNDILQQMVKRRIAVKEEIWVIKIKKRVRPIRRYRLSEGGLKIKQQVLA